MIVRTPVWAPDVNAFAERWIRAVRRECLDPILILGAKHLHGCSANMWPTTTVHGRIRASISSVQRDCRARRGQDLSSGATSWAACSVTITGVRPSSRMHRMDFSYRTTLAGHTPMLLHDHGLAPRQRPRVAAIGPMSPDVRLPAVRGTADNPTPTG